MTDQLFDAPAVTHPAQYSPEVIDVLASLIRRGDHVHDPFAGTGLRLGRLCDHRGATFSGGDIEAWPGADHRVALLDALDPAGYPVNRSTSAPTFVLVTSPVYGNKRLGDYPNGPLPTTKLKGRLTYGIALGRALHERNFARWSGRPYFMAEYWRLHAEVAEKTWARVARGLIVNVDEPIAEGWAGLLEGAGYRIGEVIPVRTQRYRGLAHDDKRADHEVVITATREEIP